MSSDFLAVITQAGLNAAVSAAASGIDAEITQIGVSATGFTPNRNTTALPNEILRVSIAGGSDVTGNQAHLTAVFDGETTFAARSVGFYLRDGTLFAVWSHPSNVLFYKTSTGRVVQSFDLLLDAVPAGSVTIYAEGDLSLYFAPEFTDMAIANTKMATAQIKTLLRQVQFNDRLLRAGV